MNETILRGAWRLATFALGAVLLLGGLYVLLHALGLIPPLYYGVPDALAADQRTVVLGVNLDREPWTASLRWGAGGLVALLLGLACLALAAARPRGEGRQVVLRGLDTEGYGDGTLTVSMRALRALVAAEAQRVRGVREATPHVRLRRGGWHVDCQVALDPAASVPEVAHTLKPRLHKALEHHTGLPVERVDVRAQIGLRDAHRRVR